MTTSTLISPKQPALHQATVYPVKEIPMVNLSGKLTKEEILRLWEPIDQFQRELRHRHQTACWCDGCEAAFQSAYRPGNEFCLDLERSYRDLLLEEFREIVSQRRDALAELVAA
jgi:hypothetical protein